MEKRTILVISPHADDSEFGMGGTIIRHLEQGDHVHILLVLAVTSDFYHVEGKFIKGKDREDEFAEVIETYKPFGNITYSIWLRDENNKYGFQVDGHLDQVPLYDLINFFNDEMARISPDVLYIPGRSTHQDHRAVFDASMSACRPTLVNLPKEIYLYELPTYFWNPPERYFIPNTYVRIDPAKKLKVVLAHQSQRRPKNNHLNDNEIIAWNVRRGMESAFTHAEAFVLIKRTIS